MGKNKTRGNFLLGLMILDAESRELARDIYTIIQAAFLDDKPEYDAAQLLGWILPPGRNRMYNGDYCPPVDADVIAFLDELFEFSLARGNQGEYKDLKITRRSDKKYIILTLKVDSEFGTSEYQKEIEKMKIQLEQKKARKLEALSMKTHLTDADYLLGEYFGIELISSK